jgi:hypothetical protein
MLADDHPRAAAHRNAHVAAWEALVAARATLNAARSTREADRDFDRFFPPQLGEVVRSDAMQFLPPGRKIRVDAPVTTPAGAASAFTAAAVLRSLDGDGDGYVTSDDVNALFISQPLASYRWGGPRDGIPVEIPRVYDQGPPYPWRNGIKLPFSFAPRAIVEIAKAFA